MVTTCPPRRSSPPRSGRSQEQEQKERNRLPDDATVDVFGSTSSAGRPQPRFANGRSVRNALERARLRQATRIVRDNNHNLSKADLMRIEAEDILASRVFDDETDDKASSDGDGSRNGNGSEADKGDQD